MTKYSLDGHDISALFDKSANPISFAENAKEYIPNRGSIIYSVWDRNNDFIYVGISGLQKDVEKRNPRSRMISHASGRRSGDQFCIYIHDYYVVPALVQTGRYSPSNGYLDRLTKQYIRENLSYRFVSFNTQDSDVIVRNLESKIKNGAFDFVPIINGTEATRTD